MLLDEGELLELAQVKRTECVPACALELGGLDRAEAKLSLAPLRPLAHLVLGPLHWICKGLKEKWMSVYVVGEDFTKGQIQEMQQ